MKKAKGTEKIDKNLAELNGGEGSPKKPKNTAKKPKINGKIKQNTVKNRKKKPKRAPTSYPKYVGMGANLLIEIGGFNQTRIINALNEEGVILKKIERHGGRILRASVQKSQHKRAAALLAAMGYECTIIEERSMAALLPLLLKNIGLVVGVFVFSCLAIAANSRIWSVKISGNQLIDSRVIEMQLKNSGIGQWSSKGSINTDTAAAILRDIDGIAEGSARIKGTTLYIYVYESQIYQPPDNNDLSGDLTSRFDAQITRVITQKGTPIVKVGDTVAVGEPLIKGEIYNTNGELLEVCPAKGAVFGLVSFTTSRIFSPIEEVVEYTGATKKHTYMTIFGLRIGKSGIESKKSWAQEQKTFYSFLLPIKFTQILYRQTKITATNRNIDEHIQQLKSEAILENVIKAGGSEISTSTTLTPIEGGLYRLNIYILAEVRIG